jgi:isoquinoline 1-oxidoreductase beta subunit
VIKAVAEMSDFHMKRPGRGMGLTFSDYHDSLSAGVAEVSIDETTGKIKVHNFWSVGRAHRAIHSQGRYHPGFELRQLSQCCA